jgi:hypothetical protein
MKLSRLRTALGRDARTIAISAAVASVVTATPAVAAIVANSDKVDGKHAVGAGASVEARAGKLVATDKKGRLPGDILAKAMNADMLDGLDSDALRVTVDGGSPDTNATIGGCGEARAFEYPLSVTERAHVFATAYTGLHVTSDELLPSIRVELLDEEKSVVAESTPAAGSGQNVRDLRIGEVLYGDNATVPYVAAPGSYTLRVQARNSGYCDSTQYVQYQDARLTHLLLPAPK